MKGTKKWTKKLNLVLDKFITNHSDVENLLNTWNNVLFYYSVKVHELIKELNNENSNFN